MESDKSENDKTEAESSEDEINKPPKNGTLRRQRTSIAWMFCDKGDNNMKATCKICNKKMSYRSSVTNLTKHARSQHPEFYRRVLEEVKLENVQEGNLHTSWKQYKEKGHRVKSTDNVYEENGADESIWKFFSLLDKSLKIASCDICNKRINYTKQLDLLHHIKKKHNDQFLPEKNVTLIVTDDDQMFEVENVDKLETLDDNTDHLQDVTNDGYEFPAVSEDYTPPKKRVKTISPQKKKLLPKKESFTIFEEPKPVPETTLDYFGKYLISMLKELPEHVSNKLQVEFVRQIVEAKSAPLPISVKIPDMSQSVPTVKISYSKNECDQ